MEHRIQLSTAVRIAIKAKKTGNDTRKTGTVIRTNTLQAGRQQGRHMVNADGKIIPLRRTEEYIA